MQVTFSEQSGVLSQFLPMMSKDLCFMPRAAEEARPEAHRVLILEKSTALAKLLATGLSAESATVDVTHDLATMRAHLQSRAYHLIILDLDLAEADGGSLLQELRAMRPDVRVLAMSGRSGIEDLVKALDHGADDYLFKPFSLLEMMARVRALRRRSTTAAQKSPRANSLVLHRDQCRVERDGRNIDLTPREFALLEVMVENAGKTLSRAMLTQKVWNMPAEANTNIVDVYVKYLRDKLDGDSETKLIRTVRGMGYILQLAS